MCMLFSYLTRKYKVMCKKEPFVLQLTNYLFYNYVEHRPSCGAK
jgi:hypothetical protein